MLMMLSWVEQHSALISTVMEGKLQRKRAYADGPLLTPVYKLSIFEKLKVATYLGKYLGSQYFLTLGDRTHAI